MQVRSKQGGRVALLFPGLDALFQSSKLRRWLNCPEARRSLDEASDYLSEMTRCREDLALFVESSNRLHLADFDRTLVALTALQIGIARRLNGAWDLAQGCSHGDVARSVICESISFRQAVELLWIFGGLRKQSPPGYTANVRPITGGSLSPEQIGWLSEMGAPPSLWSDVNCTIGGSNETLDKVRAQAAEMGLKIKPALAYPVHSACMQPCADALRAIAAEWPFRAPALPVFSSVWLRYLSSGEDVREEGLASAVEPVRWTETLATLHEREGVDVFLNVGPSNALTGWLFESPRFARVRLVDAWDMLFGAEANAG